MLLLTADSQPTNLLTPGNFFLTSAGVSVTANLNGCVPVKTVFPQHVQLVAATHPVGFSLLRPRAPLAVALINDDVMLF